MAATPVTKASLQQQIEALQKQMQDLDQAAVHELKLKLSDAKKVVSSLEAELEALTGKSSGTPKKARRERRPSIADAVLQPLIIKAIAADGKMGMNAKMIAEKVGQDPLRIRKFIKDNPKALKRTGSGPGTRFYLP